MNNTIIKSFTFIFSLILILNLFGCKKTTEDQYNAIIKSGYVVIGLDDTFAPLGFRDTENNIVGFDVDLAKATFSEMGLDARFQPIDWSMKEAELNNGNIDFIWNGYTITSERKQKVTFSDSYLANKQVIVVLSTSSITSKTDLVNKEVGVQQSSSSEDAVNNNIEIMKSFKNSEPTLYETNEQALRDLLVGRIDAVVVDEILARYYINLNSESNLKLINDDFGVEEYGVGMRKTDINLIEEFNKAFITIKNNQIASEISIKWFGEDLIK